MNQCRSSKVRDGMSGYSVCVIGGSDSFILKSYIPRNECRLSRNMPFLHRALTRAVTYLQKLKSSQNTLERNLKEIKITY